MCRPNFIIHVLAFGPTSIFPWHYYSYTFNLQSVYFSVSTAARFLVLILGHCNSYPEVYPPSNTHIHIYIHTYIYWLNRASTWDGRRCTSWWHWYWHWVSTACGGMAAGPYRCVYTGICYMVFRYRWKAMYRVMTFCTGIELHASVVVGWLWVSIGSLRPHTLVGSLRPHTLVA